MFSRTQRNAVAEDGEWKMEDGSSKSSTADRPLPTATDKSEFPSSNTESNPDEEAGSWKRVAGRESFLFQLLGSRFSLLPSKLSGMGFRTV